MLVWARRLCLVLAAGSGGCEGLLNLGDLDLETCKEMPGESPCEVLNREHGISNRACQRYQCRRDGPGCELRPKDSDNDGQPDARVCEGTVEAPLDCDDRDEDTWDGAPEICDGRDNDCNSQIDESLPPAPVTTAFTFDAGTELRFLEATQVEQGDVYVLAGETQARDSALHLLVFAQGELAPRGDKLHDVVVTLTDGNTVVGPGACIKLRDGQAQGNKCGFEEVALSVVDGAVTTAAVDTMSSALGTLRAGVLVASPTSFEIQLEGSGAQRSLSLGIGGTSAGVQGPRAIAGGPDEALLVWQTLGHRPDGAACPRQITGTCGEEASGCDDTKLFALGLTGQKEADGILALDAIGDVTGTEIGIASAVRAALTPFRAADWTGYLVAYAGRDTVELYSRTLFATEARYARGALPAGGHVTEIAVARASAKSEADLRPAAVAWRTGCKLSASVQLARLELRTDSNNWVTESMVTLRRDANVVAGPWIAHANTGFLRADRDGSASGGWFVTWIEQIAGGHQALMSRRVAETNLELVGEQRQLATGSLGLAFSFTSASGMIRYGYVERTQERKTSLRMGEAVCDPSR